MTLKWNINFFQLIALLNTNWPRINHRVVAVTLLTTYNKKKL